MKRMRELGIPVAGVVDAGIMAELRHLQQHHVGIAPLAPQRDARRHAVTSAMPSHHPRGTWRPRRRRLAAGRRQRHICTCRPRRFSVSTLSVSGWRRRCGPCDRSRPPAGTHRHAAAPRRRSAVKVPTGSETLWHAGVQTVLTRPRGSSRHPLAKQQHAPRGEVLVADRGSVKRQPARRALARPAHGGDADHRRLHQGEPRRQGRMIVEVDFQHSCPGRPVTHQRKPY